jgi:hypothetical protein
MKTSERELPRNIYFSGDSSYIAVIRHNGHRYALGSFKTIDAAQEQVDKFRAENPPRKSQNWKPGDHVR